MANLQEFRAKVQTEISSKGGFITPSMIDGWVNNAGEKVCDYNAWSWLKHSLKIPAGSVEEYDTERHVTPVRFKQGSIYRLAVSPAEDIDDETEYVIKDLDQYKAIKRDWDGSITDGDDIYEGVAAKDSGQFFLWPKPKQTDLITVSGYLKWARLEADTDQAITPSNSIDRVIERLATSDALRKQDQYSKAEKEERMAMEELERLWNKDKENAPLGNVGKMKTTRESNYSYPNDSGYRD